MHSSQVYIVCWFQEPNVAFVHSFSLHLMYSDCTLKMDGIHSQTNLQMDPTEPDNFSCQAPVETAPSLSL